MYITTTYICSVICNTAKCRVMLFDSNKKNSVKQSFFFFFFEFPSRTFRFIYPSLFIT